MFAILHALGMLLVDLFKSRSRLEAENLFLRHQLVIALRCVEQSKVLVPLSLFPSWQGCITNTSGYDLWDGPFRYTQLVTLSIPNVWPAPDLQVDFCELVSNSLL
jgi:hypothetical protein